MTLETFLVITICALLVIDQLIMLWCQNNVYLKYKEQRAWPEKAKGGKKR